MKPRDIPTSVIIPTRFANTCGHDRSFSGLHKQGPRPTCPFFGSTFGNRNRRIQFLDSEVGKDYKARMGRTALDPMELKDIKYMSQRSGDKPKDWLKRNEETSSKRSDSRDRGDRRGRSRDREGDRERPRSRERTKSRSTLRYRRPESDRPQTDRRQSETSSVNPPTVQRSATPRPRGVHIVNNIELNPSINQPYITVSLLPVCQQTVHDKDRLAVTKKADLNGLRALIDTGAAKDNYISDKVAASLINAGGLSL